MKVFCKERRPKPKQFEDIAVKPTEISNNCLEVKAKNLIFDEIKLSCGNLFKVNKKMLKQLPLATWGCSLRISLEYEQISVIFGFVHLWISFSQTSRGL